ncbi:signal peptidase I [archaeon]|nr:signal peptidase I [archaeon]MBT6762852.1 signal peptidase I [archaeon]
MKTYDKLKLLGRKTWHFLWHDESMWSWLANIVIAFIIIKFIFYPLLGLVLGTGFPVVAVVSESMEHKLYNGEICGQEYDYFPSGFDNWWEVCSYWYTNEEIDITKEQFEEFPIHNGFNKGDIIVLWRANVNNIDVGDILVFQSTKSQPIIHRVVKIWTTEKENGELEYHYQTKGDHNSDSFAGYLGEDDITIDRVYGQSLFRIPFLGYIKIIFATILQLFGINIVG